MNRLEIDGLIVRRAVLPTPREDADPCEGQGPYGGVLRLAAVAREAFVRCAAALSGFDLFFGVSFRWGHDALLDAVWVCGGGSLSTCTCHMLPRVGENGVTLRHVFPGLPAFFCQPGGVYIRPNGLVHSHTVFCTSHRHREGGR